MAQAELFNIDSPCVQVCEMDDKGYCKGCMRNRTERQLWHVMNDEQKRQVLRLLFVRKHKQKLALAKLAKQAIFAEDSVVFSQMTFFESLETSGIETSETETPEMPKIKITETVLPQTTLANITPNSPSSNFEPPPINHNQNSSNPQPKSPTKILKNSEDIKAQNWDFLAVLEDSLLPD